MRKEQILDVRKRNSLHLLKMRIYGIQVKLCFVILTQFMCVKAMKSRSSKEITNGHHLNRFILLIFIFPSKIITAAWVGRMVCHSIKIGKILLAMKWTYVWAVPFVNELALVCAMGISNWLAVEQKVLHRWFFAESNQFFCASIFIWKMIFRVYALKQLHLEVCASFTVWLSTHKSSLELMAEGKIRNANMMK